MNYFLKTLIIGTCLAVTSLTYAGALSTLTVENNRNDIYVYVSADMLCSTGYAVNTFPTDTLPDKEKKPLGKTVAGNIAPITPNSVSAATWDNCIIASPAFFNRFYPNSAHSRIYLTFVDAQTGQQQHEAVYPSDYAQDIPFSVLGKDVTLYIKHTNVPYILENNKLLIEQNNTLITVS